MRMPHCARQLEAAQAKLDAIANIERNLAERKPANGGKSTVNQAVKRKARILVVDDDPGLLRLLTIRLRAENYDVEAVENGLQAIAAATRFRPDLVISDLRMDQLDGIGLLKELQTRWPGLKVIMLTAHGTIPDAVQATQMGAFGFLTKPVEKQELLDQVQQGAARSPASSTPIRTGAPTSSRAVRSWRRSSGRRTWWPAPTRAC